MEENTQFWLQVSGGIILTILCIVICRRILNVKNINNVDAAVVLHFIAGAGLFVILYIGTILVNPIMAIELYVGIGLICAGIGYQTDVTDREIIGVIVLVCWLPIFLKISNTINTIANNSLSQKCILTLF